MQVNIKYLAQKLNLSTSTISKALRDSHEISSDTKKKVLELAAVYDYVPNAYASSLRRRKSRTIAAVLPEIADSFFSVAINGIESVAQEKGYHVLIYLTHETLFKEQSIFKDFQGGRVDGVLCSMSSTTNNFDHIHHLISQNIPVVFLDRVCGVVEAAKVLTDDFNSGYKAAVHLIQKNCKRIAFLLLENNLDIIEQRLAGYKKALLEHNMPVNEEMIVHCTNDEEKNECLLMRLFSDHHNKPDGVIGSVEKLALTTYTVCKQLSINIPGQVKVVAFSHLQIASLLSPSLTTVTQPAYNIGKAAAELLFKSLQGKNQSVKKETLILPSELIERESSR